MHSAKPSRRRVDVLYKQGSNMSRLATFITVFLLLSVLFAPQGLSEDTASSESSDSNMIISEVLASPNGMKNNETCSNCYNATDWNGDVTFAYQVSDGLLETTAKATLIVNPVDDLREIKEGKDLFKFTGTNQTKLFQYEDSKEIIVSSVNGNSNLKLLNTDGSAYSLTSGRTGLAAERDKSGDIHLLLRDKNSDSLILEQPLE